MDVSNAKWIGIADIIMHVVGSVETAQPGYQATTLSKGEASLTTRWLKSDDVIQWEVKKVKYLREDEWNGPTYFDSGRLGSIISTILFRSRWTLLHFTPSIWFKRRCEGKTSVSELRKKATSLKYCLFTLIDFHTVADSRRPEKRPPGILLRIITILNLL